MTGKIFLMAIVLTAGLTIASKVPESGGQMSEPANLIDFNESTSIAWQVANDGVMGGVSRSNIQRSDHGTGLFSGKLSMENNGGFASVRGLIAPQDLSAFSGLEIRVRGDGRTGEHWFGSHTVPRGLPHQKDSLNAGSLFNLSS